MNKIALCLSFFAKTHLSLVCIKHEQKDHYGNGLDNSSMDKRLFHTMPIHVQQKAVHNDNNLDGLKRKLNNEKS